MKSKERTAIQIAHYKTLLLIIVNITNKFIAVADFPSW